MRENKKTISIIATIIITSVFIFALYKSNMTVEQMTDIFDNTRGIGSKLAPSIANDIHNQYFLFSKNIFMLIGGFIGFLILGQFLTIRSIYEGQSENFELHQGTKLKLTNQINKTKREINQNLKELKDCDGENHVF